jgi:oleate hydratase
MKAHIVGGGFGGLAAAALLIRNAGLSGTDITIYEAGEVLGGGFFLGGNAKSGYNLPGSVFDKEFRCTFELLESVPSARDPSISVTKDFFAFNTSEPYQDKAHILDRDGRIVHGPRFGLSLADGLCLARVVLTPEATLDGRRVDEFFSQRFFSTEFWYLWSTIMGSLPQSSVIEFRRYMNRFLYLFGDLSNMTGVMRTPLNQHQNFVEPLVRWLTPHGVNFLTSTFVKDISFAPSARRITVDGFDYERDGAVTSVVVAPDDIVLVTTGSQAADLSPGSMTEAPIPRPTGRSWALWERLARGRIDFGNPDVFFGASRIPDSLWVTFTVTDTGSGFVSKIAALTDSKAGRGGLVTLKDSGWVISLSVFHQPEIIGQPTGTSVWWGYGLYPGRIGDFVKNAWINVPARRSWRRRCANCASMRSWTRSWRHRFACLATCPTSTTSGSLGAVATCRRLFQRGRPISGLSASTSTCPGKSPSPSSAPCARHGRRSMSFSSAVLRRRPSIRANTIRRRCSGR